MKSLKFIKTFTAHFYQHPSLFSPMIWVSNHDRQENIGFRPVMYVSIRCADKTLEIFQYDGQFLDMEKKLSGQSRQGFLMFSFIFQRVRTYNSLNMPNFPGQGAHQCISEQS